jgi:hypothetical protein
MKKPDVKTTGLNLKTLELMKKPKPTVLSHDKVQKNPGNETGV